MRHLEFWKKSLRSAQSLLAEFLQNEELLKNCNRFTELVVQTIQNKKNLFACGNGGSHCDAMHFAEEWTGRYRKNRIPIGALALGDPAHLSCVANDFGYEHVFERQLQGLGRPGDLLLAISTSGESKNVIRAVEAAKKIGIQTVGLLGKSGGILKNLVDLPLVVPGQSTERIQELHIKIIHNVIESAERELFPENYL